MVTAFFHDISLLNADIVATFLRSFVNTVYKLDPIAESNIGNIFTRFGK